MRSGVPPDAGKAQESLLEAVVVILVLSQPNCWQDRDGEA